MAKQTRITTGNTDLLKKFWEYALTMKIGRIVDQTLDVITKASSDEASPYEQTGNQLTLKHESGELLTINASAFDASGKITSATDLTYTYPNGVTLRLEGKLFFNSTGALSPTSKISRVSMTDSDGILYAEQTIGVTNAAGDISFTRSGDVTAVAFNLKDFERILQSDDEPISGAFGFINRIEKSASDGSWSASGVIDEFTLKDSSGVLLKLEKIDNNQLNANDPEVIEALSSADKFIAYYLKGNDQIRAIGLGGTIDGYAGNDTLIGAGGQDTLIGGDGNDSVSAGDGADLIVGGNGAGNDSYDGGKGIDTVKYSSAKAGIRVDLAKGTAGSIAAQDSAGIGTDKLKGIENIVSGDFADGIIGSKDANSIIGGDGNDTIDGGLGNDTLVGGTGADVFVFSAKPAVKNVDVLTGFETGIDKIQLSVKAFAKLRGVTDYLVTGAPSTATHYLSYDSITGKLSYDADGSGLKIKPIDIALIGKGLDLSTSDFMVI
jgi:Ca2+-binding RTX toxin-like protein